MPIIVTKEAEDGRFCSALMLNYSEGGLYFELSDPLETGAGIIVKTDDASILDPVGFGTWRRRPAEVRWCLKLEGTGARRYGCGVQYINENQQ